MKRYTVTFEDLSVEALREMREALYTYSRRLEDDYDRFRNDEVMGRRGATSYVNRTERKLDDANEVLALFDDFLEESGLENEV